MRRALEDYLRRAGNDSALDSDEVMRRCALLEDDDFLDLMSDRLQQGSGGELTVSDSNLDEYFFSRP